MVIFCWTYFILKWKSEYKASHVKNLQPSCDRLCNCDTDLELGIKLIECLILYIYIIVIFAAIAESLDPLC